MQQIQRIMQMEAIFQETQTVIEELLPLLEKYRLLQEKIDILSKYYGSPEWRQDFAADEQGKLPTTLKRGVLSEDGVWLILQEHTDLLQEMKEILNHNFQAA